MRKLLLPVILTAALFAADKPLSQQELNSVIKASAIYPQLSEAMKKGEIKLKGTKKDGFYIIEVETPRGKGLIYMTADKKYTIIGRVINNQTKKPLLPNFPKNADVVKKGVMFTFGSGNKDIYLVTDPECPFCRMMEKQKKDVLEKNYRVHVILYPLPFHKNAKAMSYYVLAGKTDKERAQRMKEVLSGSDAWKNYRPSAEEKAEFDKQLALGKKAVDELGARGTPSVYDENFNPIEWPKLGVER